MGEVPQELKQMNTFEQSPYAPKELVLLRTWEYSTSAQVMTGDLLVLPEEYEQYQGLLIRTHHILSTGVPNYRGAEHFIPTIVLQNCDTFLTRGDVGTVVGVCSPNSTSGNSDWLWFAYMKRTGVYWWEAGYKYNNMSAADKALYDNGTIVCECYGVKSVGEYALQSVIPVKGLTQMDLLKTSTTLEADLRVTRAVLEQYDYLFVRCVTYSNGTETHYGNEALIPVIRLLPPNADLYLNDIDGASVSVTSGHWVDLFIIAGYASDSSCGVSYWWAGASSIITKPTFKCLVYGLR